MNKFKLKIIILDIFFGIDMFNWMRRYDSLEPILPPREVKDDPEKLCAFIGESDAHVVLVEEADLHISEYKEVPDFISYFLKSCVGKRVFNTTPIFASFQREEGSADHFEFPKFAKVGMFLHKDMGSEGLFGAFLHNLRHYVQRESEKS